MSPAKISLSRALRISSGDVVALVGGGGKTSALFRLANELSQASPSPLRVLVTTTTRIFAAQIKLAPSFVTFDPARQSLADLRPDLQAACEQHGQVLLIGQADAGSGKALGVVPDLIDALAASGWFDVILIEADGSRMRPFKAPAEHEPQIPASTTLVVPVVGIEALGRPLTDHHVHRANLVSQLSHTPLGQPVTLETVAKVLTHPRGGLKSMPSSARVAPLLNKVENNDQLGLAQALADHLLAAPRLESVVIGAVGHAGETKRSDLEMRPTVSEVRGRTAAVILAAGGSTRFGSPKQLARWQGQTFIERAVETALASQAEPVIVVLGAEAGQSRALLQNHPVQIVVNPNWADGQSSSMAAGLAALPDNVQAVVFLLVDLPGITPSMVDLVIDRHRQTLAPLVWPEYQGRRGHPILFDRGLFPDLKRVRGDTGGRPVVMAYQDRAERVEVNDPAIIQDIDRPEDLARVSGG